VVVVVDDDYDEEEEEEEEEEEGENAVLRLTCYVQMRISWPWWQGFNSQCTAQQEYQKMVP
jgi:hypothetical protein